ncbi:uncharacterized protein LOC106693789 [Microplitis demolitor]|uniref:uncharacterized protein LOC106693789 n=1 Tax=Microplitis demolitor TaxID=69319 RepID=UPI00235B5EC0|nr:uncharacterized protein LOC106693789 [Microplitis demolitor]
MNHSDNILCNISKQSYMAHVIREAKLIVWDECTMAHKNVIEALNRTLKDIRNSDRIMGGITVVLASDFRQTLPVVPRGTRADEVKACLKSSVLWPHVNVLSLKINMRVHIQHDLRAEEFSKLLIDIGNGQISEVDGRISIPDNLGDIVDDLTTLTDKIYPDINKIGVNCSSWLKERAILTPTNDSANSINNYLIEKLSTNQMKYKSIDTVVEVDDAVHYPVEFLHTLNPPGIPSHILNLKIGAPIMLLRNLNPPKLCNGKHEGEVVFIPRIPLVPSDYHFNFKRLQFPVRVCYAMTINKAQGQSLKLAGVDLRHDCFSHGQFYVACSRVSSPDNLIILQPEKKTKNIVYKEVLSFLTPEKYCLFVGEYLLMNPPHQEFLIREFGLSPNTYSDWSSFIREVWEYLVIENSDEKIGGRGKIVEIDKAKFGKRKYNRGRVIDGEWIFSGIERETNKVFMETVPDRTQKTLLEVIKRKIRPHTTIISDCWRAYDCLEDEGFKHLKVNHSLNFVNPEEEEVILDDPKIL